LPFWHGDMQRALNEGKVWHIEDNAWSLSLDARSAGTAPPVKLLLVEEQVFPADDGRWVHQTEFLLAARGDADLRVALPARSYLVALTVNDQPFTPRLAGPEVYGIPVGGTAGAHTLKLRWRYLADAEPFDQPNLGGVHVVGVKTAPLQGQLLVPSGHVLASLPAGSNSSQLQHLARRASAQLALCRFLADLPPGDVAAALAAAQRSMAWSLRQAELQLSYLADGEDKLNDSAILADLRKQYEHFVRDKGLENVRVLANKPGADTGGPAPALALVPEQGAPAYWQLPHARQVAAATLVDHAAGNGGAAQSLSQFLLLAAVSLVILSFVPHSLGSLAILWPELCSAAGLVGMVLWGFSLFGVLLVCVGVLGRLYWVVRVLRKLITALLQPIKAGSPSTMTGHG
jgi:hypothetical protein